MRLQVGMRAPIFDAASWDGTTIRLADFEGRKLWLAFFRYASCPLCNLQVRDLIQRYPDLASRGLAIAAVFQSPAASIAEYVGRQRPPFPLLADPGEGLYRLYGLEASVAAFASPRNYSRAVRATLAGFAPGRMEGTRTRIPGDFLIDEGGVIRDLFYGEVIADHIPFERVEAFLGSPAQRRGAA